MRLVANVRGLEVSKAHRTYGSDYTTPTTPVNFALLYALIVYATYLLGATKYTYTHTTIRPVRMYRELPGVRIRLVPISIA